MASVLAVAAVVVLVRRLRQATAKLDEVGLPTRLPGRRGARAAPTPSPAPAAEPGRRVVQRPDRPSTGLFSEGYFDVALDARIAAARRHLDPVAVVLIEVIEGLGRRRCPAPADPNAVAESINATIRDADTACRLTDGGYALVLEDTPENGAIWTVERIRRHLAGVSPA